MERWIASLVCCGTLMACVSAPLAEVAGAPEPTRIEVDQAAGEIRFIVDGSPVARLVSSGFVVHRNVSYQGVLEQAPRTP